MLIRSMMLMFAIGCVGTEAVEDQTVTTEQQSSSGHGMGCQNNSVISGVTCVGSILAVIPVKIDIKNVNVLSGNDLDVLTDSLNDVNVSNILNYNAILNGLDLSVLDVFNNKLNIPIVGNDVDTCLTVLGGLLCH